MEYWQDGQRIVRMRASDLTAGEIFNWRTSSWRTDDRIGGDVRFTGNWSRITEAEATRLTRAAVAG